MGSDLLRQARHPEQPLHEVAEELLRAFPFVLYPGAPLQQTKILEGENVMSLRDHATCIIET